MLLGRSFRPAAVRAWQAPASWQQHRRLLTAPRHGVSATTQLALTARSRPLVPATRATAAAWTPIGRRWETSTTGDDQSGHIEEKPGEGILFFDNIYPLGLGKIVNWRPWRSTEDTGDVDVSKLLHRFMSRRSTASSFDPVALVKRSIPDDLPLTVTEIIPRLKDGGVFVKFKHPASTSKDVIEDTLEKALTKSPVRPWFNPFFGCIRGGLVRGVPWLEDLASRVPSSRVRVEFCAPAAGGDAVTGDAGGSANLEMSQETIYSLFRRYGKIAEITSQPFDSKTLPRFANVDFVRVRDAVMARCCLHGYTVGEVTRLRLSFAPRERQHRIWDWLTNHPRIVLPILAALLAAFTVAVFDPIRAFFIRAKVQRSFEVRDSRIFKWFQRNTSSFVAYAKDKVDDLSDGMGLGDDNDDSLKNKDPSRRALDALLSHRRDLLDSLHSWLLETSETFIVVQGPRGSGKNELVVDQALRGRHDVLVIDCKPIVEARGESMTIKKLANAVGYSPVFAWASGLSSLVDLAVQGTTGVKAGFSETLDEQLDKILQTAATALRDVSLEGRHKADVDAQLNDDAYLEAHPERRAVIVLDNFGHRNEEATGLVYDKMAEWAASLVQSNSAHVIILTSDTSSPKALTKALPDRVFRQLALGDLSPDVAKKYVLSHLVAKDEEEEQRQKEEEEELRQDDAAEGRPTDLQAEAQKRIAKQREEQLVQQAEKQLAQQEEQSASGASVADTATTTATPDKDAAAAAAEPLHAKVVAAIKGAAKSSDPAKKTAAATGGPMQFRHDAIHELDECIGTLGGRLTDLESLVRRLKSGQTPKRAVNEIVEQSASEIIKMYLLTAKPSAPTTPPPAGAPGPVGRGWTTEQAWYLVREIAAKESLRYNEVLLSDTFASSTSGIDGVSAIDALAAAELITVKSARGRPQTIRAGRPVYGSAFSLLKNDTALAARLDRRVLKEKVDIEGQNVAKAESELALLGALPKQPWQMSERVTYLLNKLQGAQTNIASYEAEMGRLKKVLSEEV